MLRILVLLIVLGSLAGPLTDEVRSAEDGDYINGPDFQSAPPGSFNELVGSRSRQAKLFQHDTDPELFRFDASMGTLHYESIPYSGNFDTEVDLSPRRINNAQLDGWLVTANGWHHALGQPGDKLTDGWVGIGPRDGQHFLEFRLAQVAYVHWPTRALDDLGGAPTYNRANLAATVENVTIGDRTLNVSASATWSNLWTTPGGGSLNVSWQASGDGIKEEIRINEAGRTWIQNNRPPATPLAETYLAFIFNVDWNDIPKIVRQGLEQDRNTDFDDLNGTASLELRDALDRVLAFLPIGEILVQDPSSADPSEFIDSLSLRRRFYEQGGEHFMALGVRTDLMAGLANGDLVYDPTINVAIAGGADDCDTEQNNPGLSCSGGTHDVPGNDAGEGDVGNASFLFRNVDIPQGSIVINATFSPFTATDGDDGAGTRSRIFFEADDNATVPTSETDFDNRNRTTNFTAWDDENFAEQFSDSPDVGPAAQEVINRTGWQANASLQLFWQYVFGAGAGMNYEHRSYEDSAARAARLSITFTSAEIPVVDTLPADPVLGLSARLNGDLVNIQNLSSVEAFFEWGDTIALGNTTAPSETLTANGTFSFDLTGLLSSVQYFFRAHANSGNGTILNFTTLAAFVPPNVVTDPVSSQAQTSAVLEGTITTLGELNITQANVSFEWGLSPTALDFNTTPQLVAIPGSFDDTITGLDPGTTYFYRAVIQWQPTAFGEVESFTTEFSSFFERPETVAAIVLSIFAILVCLLALRRRDRALAAICGLLVILAGFVWLSVLTGTLFADLVAFAIVAVGLIIFIGAAIGRRV